MYKRVLTDKEYQRMSNEYDKIKIKCSYCGRKMVVPMWIDKRLCSWCGHYIFRNKKLEFEDKLKKKIKEKN